MSHNSICPCPTCSPSFRDSAVVIRTNMDADPAIVAKCRERTNEILDKFSDATVVARHKVKPNLKNVQAAIDSTTKLLSTFEDKTIYLITPEDFGYSIYVNCRAELIDYERTKHITCSVLSIIEHLGGRLVILNHVPIDKVGGKVFYKDGSGSGKIEDYLLLAKKVILKQISKSKV